MQFFGKTITIFQLGLGNIFRVVLYRLRLKLKIHPAIKLTAPVPTGPFFPKISCNNSNILVPMQNWATDGNLFGCWNVKISRSPPDWYLNYVTRKRSAYESKIPWWKVEDFDNDIGDIKFIWELSRFSWVLAYAQRASCDDKFSHDRLNVWLSDWAVKNPPYMGANWKCGQEASIRVLHLAIAAIITKTVNEPTESMLSLIKTHLERISATIQYAIAQDNNHGTSEAAALFVGGSWLNLSGDKRGLYWMRLGRKWLENRAKRLIGKNGTFSQYSLNYHRLMLDTYCIVEVWRRHLGLDALSLETQSKLRAATKWLYHMICEECGDGPNVGANDGAHLLHLTDTGFRDYRPSVQLASALFIEKLAYKEDGKWNDALSWLEVKLPKDAYERQSAYIANDGGFAILRNGSAMAMLRYPRYKFRPGQSDALHLDLWVNGVNVLCDAGSFSYNDDPVLMNYFNSTEAHNTVQFDSREQMPRYGRFLLGRWLKTLETQGPILDSDEFCFSASYKDSYGSYHKREIRLANNSILINDSVSGFKNKAVFRWRIGEKPMEITRGKSGARIKLNSTTALNISANVSIDEIQVVNGLKSIFYSKYEPINVLEVSVTNPCHMVTKFTF